MVAESEVSLLAPYSSSDAPLLGVEVGVVSVCGRGKVIEWSVCTCEHVT